MLKSLTIRNIVLIESMRLEFSSGLSILTGETGAGKSILLDALGLALGGRADAALVRLGTEKAVVSAEFDVLSGHQAFALAEYLGLSVTPDDTTLILRRSLGSNGRSSAFVNDEPVTVTTLKALGETLIEIHGQHDDRGLLNATGHRALLDAFGGHEGKRAKVSKAYCVWQQSVEDLAKMKSSLQKRKVEEDYDRHCYEELKALDPKPDEEDQLANARALMMQGEKAKDQLAGVLTILEEGEGVDVTIRKALRRLERLPKELTEHMQPALKALEAATDHAEEGIASVRAVTANLIADPEKLDQTEERLFALRALARKHNCLVSDLPALKDKLAQKLVSLEEGSEALAQLKAAVSKKQDEFEKAAGALSRARQKAARMLDKGVEAELPPLKLEKAKFRTRLSPLEPENWGAEGAERVEFEISTNPGAPFAPLLKIASGGELARFILALKVVLARAGAAPCLIFDEVDRGVGGAVADAVGDRLARLANDAQVLVVTHSPQVAARAATHWRVDKEDLKGTTITTINQLDEGDRREEIARMLSGASVTDKARAAAGSLIAGAE